MNATAGNGAPTLTIPTGYNGPDGSGNGGYTAGLLAARAAADGDCVLTDDRRAAG